jgi:hypothetical protein
VFSIGALIFINHYISTGTIDFLMIFRMRRLKMQYKQAAGFIVGFFITLGILGILASFAVPHAIEMAHQEKAQEKETELLRIQYAVDEMLRQSPSGELDSIGPVTDLNLVRTADAPPLVLTDYLTEKTSVRCLPGCTYSFTADGLVRQMTN